MTRELDTQVFYDTGVVDIVFTNRGETNLLSSVVQSTTLEVALNSISFEDSHMNPIGTFKLSPPIKMSNYYY